MAEEQKMENQATGRRFQLQKIYLRDVSFESPQAPGVFRGQWNPNLTVNLASKARQIEGALHEVVLSLNVEAKQDDKVAFLVELEQAGLFHIEGFSREELGRILGIVCPDNLFPFAREEVANLTSKGGFPQVLLQPINFEQLYRQQLAQETKGNA